MNKDEIKIKLMNFNKSVQKLLIYSGIKSNRIIKALCEIHSLICEKNDLDTVAEKYYEFLPALIGIAEKNGFSGNILQRYIASLILRDENLFSLACEKNHAGSFNTSSLYRLAQKDISSLITILLYDFNDLLCAIEIGTESRFDLSEYVAISPKKNPSADGLLDCININKSATAAATAVTVIAALDNAVLEYLTFSYNRLGAGNMANYAMFKLNLKFDKNYDKHPLTPIQNSDTILFRDIIGYDMQETQLRKNTEAFINGLPAHNALLIGSRGTGKSSMVKALINEYFNDGLRLIEITKDDFDKIPILLGHLEKRGKKFILFLDDLSFDEFETGYKYLKSLLEGSAEKRPNNVLFYATSNRRHIIAEKWSDKSGAPESDEVHTTDTVNEKLSLSDRFGLTVTFPTPTLAEYTRIITGIAQNKGLNLTEEQILKGLKAWIISQSGLSGRSAKQYVDYLICSIELP